MQKPMPPRLTVVGPLERPDHHHLPEQAKCYFWGEYTPHEHTEGKLWNFSATNQLIGNLKKRMDRAGFADWRYKQEAVERVGRAFSKLWKWPNVIEKHRIMLVPIPPSKARGNPMYDPRMNEILLAIGRNLGVQLDIRDCLSFSGRYGASHETDDRPTPDQLHEDLTFDAVVGRPAEQPGLIFIFDDMLTSGAHYLAATRRLSEHFPNVQMIGNFVARRILPNPFANLADDFDIVE
ncbi:hypothetical protein R75461_08122 [Paraburkholderia nemoris]|uniref:hypothetical protein n=1 Tax=Paraburkholderia nemoris TaxID=2793076 RepID=UPI00190B1EF5|nr:MULTISPECIES: hypothetical protein [Paraburkholderia]MBK3786756.1 hypothetical protein [Paraburkholderia aspalathi]CAE6863602.1 hypothetical protein R75461_08122 [Paraburkholderia nemoris]